jgi:NADH-quinone oxidoreductase subunit M
MFGPVTNPVNEHLPDLNAREFATLVPLVLLAFWIGIYPKPLFQVLDMPVRQIVQQVNPSYYNSATAQRWGEKPPALAPNAVAAVQPDTAKAPNSASSAAVAPAAGASAPVAASMNTTLAANATERR